MTNRKETLFNQQNQLPMSQTLDEKITILGDLYEGAKNCVHTLTPMPPARYERFIHDNPDIIK